MRRACLCTCSSCYMCCLLRQVLSCRSACYSTHKRFPAGCCGGFFGGQEESTMAMSRQNQLVAVFCTPLSEKLPLLLPPHTMTSSMYCRCSGASPFSHAVWISPWQMVGLCFHPWDSQLQVYWTPLQGKAKCGLHSSAKGMEKNALAISVVAYHLAALESS